MKGPAGIGRGADPAEASRVGARIPRSAIAGSVAVHVLMTLVLFRMPSSLEAVPLRTYRVRLVATAAELAPRAQRPSPPKPTETERRERRPEPTPEPARNTEAETKEVPDKEPEQPPAAAEESGEETVNVQLDGAVFAYPEYLENIVRQINRYWRRPTGGRHLRAEIVFVIESDGTVREVEWVQKSGDASFDLEARGAVEAAGRSRAFGPLPEGYPRDRLRVSFYFDPRN
ncbi:MAG: TonB C-terminal domain-containing protein [Gemmatimonadota bacterium]|nr:MAG: TonB C-terminal domain-containing protein [Gemmatimonadota bacterium]